MKNAVLFFMQRATCNGRWLSAIWKGGNMKRFKLWVLTFLLIVSTLAPMTVYAEGEGNIDNGGGGLGEGTDTNFGTPGMKGCGSR